MTADATVAGVTGAPPPRSRRPLPRPGEATASPGAGRGQVLSAALPHPPLASPLDFRMTSSDPGRVTVALATNAHHCTSWGVVHGGVIATLCDMACAAAAQTLMPAGTTAIPADLSLHYLRPVTLKVDSLECRGHVRTRTARVVISEASVVDAAGTVFAHATSTLIPRARG